MATDLRSLDIRRGQLKRRRPMVEQELHRRKLEGERGSAVQPLKDEAGAIYQELREIRAATRKLVEG
jgi:hypothetical protein